MTRKRKQKCREAERALGYVSANLKSEAEFFQMLDATERYKADGDRAALFRAFLALGIDAECARWHSERPGLRSLLLDKSTASQHGHPFKGLNFTWNEIKAIIVSSGKRPRAVDRQPWAAEILIVGINA